MNSGDKAKKQLINELEEMGQQVALLEASGEKHEQDEEIPSVIAKNYDKLYGDLPIGITIVDTKGVILYCNPALYKQGYAETEFTGKHFSKISSIKVQDTQKFIRMFYSIVRGKKPEPLEVEYIRKDGSTGWVEVHISLVKVDEKRCILVAQYDTTERRRQQEQLMKQGWELKERNKELNCLYQVSEIVRMEEVSLEGTLQKIVEVIPLSWQYPDEACARIVLNAQTFTSKNFTETEWKQASEIMVHGKSNGALEVYYLKELPVCDYGPFLKSERLLIDSLAERIGRITERKRAEEALRQSEEKYRTILEEMQDSYFEVDLGGHLTFVNNSVCRHLGYTREELIGMNYKQFTVEEYIESIFRVFNEIYQTGEPHKSFNWQIIRKDGVQVFVETWVSPLRDDKGEIIGFRCVGRDITVRRQLEEQLMITDRLVSVGELASGIAHELNNPLTGIIGLSELLTEKDMAEDTKEDLKLIYREAQRAANVVKGLLTFARKHPPTRKLINVNDVICKVLELRAYEQKVSNIETVTNFAPDLPEIWADFFQLQQVFLNIVINAEYFMLKVHNKGTFTITTERVGDIVRISFADDGPGISEKDLGHVFDPFFTTKEVGQGTGLGLSISHGIVVAHGGHIYAESKQDMGATFIVELPINIKDHIKSVQ